LNPLVSVIIPCRNGEAFLRECLESVLSSDYKSLEVILVDDGSTDQSSEIARSFGDEVTVLRTEGIGAAAARNIGLKHSRGKYIQFFDADDIMGPEKIRRSVERLECNREIDMHFQQFWHFDGTGKRWPRRDFPDPSEYDSQVRYILQNFHGTGCGIYRRECLEAIGGWRGGLRKWDDVEINLRLVCAGFQFEHSNERLWYYRDHSVGPRISRASLPEHYYVHIFAWPARVLARRKDASRLDKEALGLALAYHCSIAGRNGHFATARRGYALCRELLGYYPHVGTRLGIRLPHPLVRDFAKYLLSRGRGIARR
jgi:glycosyltransferase involved in cell wall biosynthesis